MSNSYSLLWLEAEFRREKLLDGIDIPGKFHVGMVLPTMEVKHELGRLTGQCDDRLSVAKRHVRSCTVFQHHPNRTVAHEVLPSSVQDAPQQSLVGSWQRPWLPVQLRSSNVLVMDEELESVEGGIDLGWSERRKSRRTVSETVDQIREGLLCQLQLYLALPAR